MKPWAALALICGLTACGGSVAAKSPASSSPTTAVVSGTLTLRNPQQSLEWALSSGTGIGTCQGELGYADVAPGAQVVLSDQDGKTLALTSLSNGKVGTGPGTPSCVFTFVFAAAPLGHPFYGIAISHRGVIQYDEATLKAGPQLNLGS